jgi:pimeloyl-ACP methyl ester carboxylesterase
MMKEVENAAKKGLWSAALGTAASSIDRAVVRAMQMRNARVRARAEALDHAERMRALEAIASTYALDDLSPRAFFPDPPPIAPRLDRVRRVGHVEVLDATWESRYEPYGADVRERYLSHANNRSARARLFLSDVPRPAVILIHGYMGGQWLVEERQWPVSWLVRKGLDVVLPVLPFHAVRGDGGPPHFPGADPRYTNEGFRQAAHDLRSIVAFLRARGAPSVGVMGMSLGGFTTALLATVEPELAFAVPMIPLASIADFAREQGRFTGSPQEADLQHEALERANFPVSPLARPCLLSPERVLVIAAEADRITPIAHARKIADHFGARLVTIPGGHLLQIGRGDAFREVARLLGRLGILPPRA